VQRGRLAKVSLKRESVAMSAPTIGSEEYLTRPGSTLGTVEVEGTRGDTGT
jgi:hypothetical protein